MKKFLQGGYIFLIFALLYAPIAVLIIFSFNESGSLSEFSGFSLMWYCRHFWQPSSERLPLSDCAT